MVKKPYFLLSLTHERTELRMGSCEKSRKRAKTWGYVLRSQAAFLDEKRVIAEDLKHSQEEQRYYCFGSNEEGTGILTVRFTYRSGRIRIIGAGYWREGKKVYEQANSV